MVFHGRAFCALISCILLACSHSRAPKRSDAGVAGPIAAHNAGAPTSSAPTHWKGDYKSIAGSLFVPGEHDVPNANEWSRVGLKDDGDSTGIGDGTLEWDLDPNGRLSGTLDGPLGHASIVGTRAGDEVTARIYPKELSAVGYYGTLAAKVTGTTIEGGLKVSSANGGHLRQAHFSLAKNP